jgi:hypothetical protein
VTGSELGKPSGLHVSKVRLAVIHREFRRAAFLQVEVGHLVFGPGKLCTAALEEAALQLSIPKGVITDSSKPLLREC